MIDLISRADAVSTIIKWASGEGGDIVDLIESLPSAEAVQGYTEWLEKLIVDLESFEWICEDTNDKEWCEENCNYSSIQADCLRHLYEVSKGGEEYEKYVEQMEHDIMYETTYNPEDGSL